MSTTNEAVGVVLLCDHAGSIIEIVRDSIGIGSCLQSGRLFASVVDQDSSKKAEAFFSELTNQKAAFNWEFNVKCSNDIVQSLHFAGGAAGNQFIVVGARSRAGVASFYNELTAINNEQTNALRMATKDLSLQIREQTDRDNHYYDELSRLNNELATTQRELAKTNAQLSRLNEQKNQFLGIAAHDLRNPLEVINSYSEFLLEDAAPMLEAEQIEFIHVIRQSSSFMLSLVNDFLDISKIEAGKLELDRSKVNLTDLVRRNAERNQILADKKAIKIISKLDEDVPPMLLDAPKIEQVLNNLIGNAVKFSPVGSTIRVSLQVEGEQKAVITIEDSGPGITKEELEKLFDPFVKGKSQSTGGEKSTGLGLAIVKKIVEGHGGNISVKSEPGNGSTFKMLVPIGLSLNAA